MGTFHATAVRNLLKKARGPFPAYSGAPAIFRSPDGRYAVVFSHGEEVSMMDSRFRMTLLDSDLAVLELFEPVLATCALCAWTSDSRVFACAAFFECDCYVLCDVSKRCFACVRVSSRQSVWDFEGTSGFRVRFDPEQLALMNSDGVFPDGAQAEFPIPRFVAPDEVVLTLPDLEWHGHEELAEIDKISEKSVVVNMSAKEEGYFPYHGKFPGSTNQKLNGRPMEVFHLEAFAGYGDRQAQVWLTEIRKKAGKGYDRWARVSRYLGISKRTIAPPKSDS